MKTVKRDKVTDRTPRADSGIKAPYIDDEKSPYGDGNNSLKSDNDDHLAPAGEHKTREGNSKKYP